MGKRYYFILAKLILLLPWHRTKCVIFHAKQTTHNNNNGEAAITPSFKFQMQHACGRFLISKFSKENFHLWGLESVNYFIVSVTTKKYYVGAASIHDFQRFRIWVLIEIYNILPIRQFGFICKRTEIYKWITLGTPGDIFLFLFHFKAFSEQCTLSIHFNIKMEKRFRM